MPFKGASLEDWGKVILAATKRTEEVFKIKADISCPIFEDVVASINKGLESLKPEEPNSAKVAGVAAFWIRKLKPIFHGRDVPRVFLAINEYVSLIVGLGICYRSGPAADASITNFDPRILNDWVYSFRYHSHSPNSSIIAFETLLSKQNVIIAK